MKQQQQQQQQEEATATATALLPLEICNLLGVTPEKGTCQRHPNIVIYHPNHYNNITADDISDDEDDDGPSSSSSSPTSSSFSPFYVDSCLICDSELRAGGDRKQRKTFANLIYDIKGMHDTEEWSEYKHMTWGEEEEVIAVGVVADDDDSISHNNNNDETDDTLDTDDPTTNIQEEEEEGGGVEIAIDSSTATKKQQQQQDIQFHHTKPSPKQQQPLRISKFGRPSQAFNAWSGGRGGIDDDGDNDNDGIDEDQQVDDGDGTDGNIDNDLDLDLDDDPSSVMLDTNDNNKKKEKKKKSNTKSNKKKKKKSKSLKLQKEQREVLIREFKNHVEISDRMYRFKIYRRCFVARDAVDFLVNSGHCKSRQEAVQLGRTLQIKYNIFDHVTLSHIFADDYLFFKFCDDEDVKEVVDDTSKKENKVTNKNEITKTKMQVFDNERNSSSSSSSNNKNTNIVFSDKIKQDELDEFAKIFKMNAVVKDRNHHFKTYRSCFVAKEAVDFMVNLGYCENREQAVKLGKSLQVYCNLFEHVKRDRLFEDRNWLFYFIDHRQKNKTTINSNADTITVASTASAISGDISYYENGRYDSNIGSVGGGVDDGSNNNEGGLKTVGDDGTRPAAAAAAAASDFDNIKCAPSPSATRARTTIIIDDDFIISIAKRAAEVSALNQKVPETLDPWGDRDRDYLQEEKRQQNVKFSNNNDHEDDKNEIVANLRKELKQAKDTAESKDLTIHELQARIDRQERQLIYELRLIAAEKRAKAKGRKGEEEIDDSVEASVPPPQFVQTEFGTILTNPNDVATYQIDKAKFDLASTQEIANQREVSLKSTIRIQTAALEELQIKYNQQQEEMEKLKRGGGSSSGRNGGTSSYATYASNPNLVNQIEKLRRDYTTAQEDFAKKEMEYQSMIEFYEKKLSSATNDGAGIDHAMAASPKKPKSSSATTTNKKANSKTSRGEKGTGDVDNENEVDDTPASTKKPSSSSSKKTESKSRTRSRSPKKASTSSSKSPTRTRSPRSTSTSPRRRHAPPQTSPKREPAKSRSPRSKSPRRRVPPPPMSPQGESVRSASPESKSSRHSRPPPPVSPKREPSEGLFPTSSPSIRL